MKNSALKSVGMTALFLVGVISLSAEPMWNGKSENENPDRAMYNKQVNQILAQNKNRQLSSMTVDEIMQVMDKLSVARQEYHFVKQSEALSRAMPGLGQFRNGDSLGGALFLGGDILLFAGTVIGAYYLLPANLQFQSIDYFHDSYSTIETAWKNHSFIDYLPSAALVLGGAILQGILREISAHNAGELAKKNIAEGTVTFTPEPILLFGRNGVPAFGMGMQMRY